MALTSTAFNGASAFNSDLSNWNTAAVTNMERSTSTSTCSWMVSRLILLIDFFLSFKWFFFSIDHIVTIILSVRSGVVAAVFQNADEFNANVSMWDTGKVTNMANSTSTSVPHLFMNGVSIDFAN